MPPAATAPIQTRRTCFEESLQEVPRHFAEALSGREGLFGTEGTLNDRLAGAA